MLRRIAALNFVLFAASLSLRAQHAVPETMMPGPAAEEKSATPEKAWLDLRQNAPANSTPQTAPAWVEAVSMDKPRVVDGVARSVLRIRLTRPKGDYSVLFLRLFFDDNADARPELVAWDEVGMLVMRSGLLGSGVGVATSESVMIPAKEVSTIDIEVPGDGKTVRGVYMDWMTISEVVHPANIGYRDLMTQPFSSMPALRAPDQDTEQFGTVTAALAPETIKIGPSFENGGAFEFGIESQPLVALLTFEVASPRVDSPPEIYINGQDVGPATMALPDLSDPGYRGEMESLLKEMQFRYTGWLRAQKVIPASNLKAGTNNLLILAGPGTPASAIRGTQIQLKYLWEKSDYLLKPTGK